MLMSTSSELLINCERQLNYQSLLAKMTVENKLVFARDLIKSSSVPELTVDLDNTPLDFDSFEEYRKVLNIQLPLLFDFIQQNQDLIYSTEYNEEALEIKARLLILATEVTADNTLYRIRNEEHLRYLNEFIQNSFNRILDSKVDEFVLRHYAQHLKPDMWKRHIGAVHGFLKFLKVKVSNGRKLPITWSNLSLSAGLKLRDCHLPVYKEKSTQVFQIIVTSSDPKEISKQNIPDVIFDALLKSLRTVDTVNRTKAVWKCICDCLEFKNDRDSYKWDLTDELMENLLTNIKHNTNTEIVMCHLTFIPKILLRFSENRAKIEQILARGYDSLSQQDFVRLRIECSKINSHASYRWVVYVLKLFQAESHKLLQDPKTCERILQLFHIWYLTCAYIIEVDIINIILLKFFQEYCDIMMEALATHGETPEIREVVKQIYRTFIDHLEKSDLKGVTKDFLPYYKAFKNFVEKQ